MHLSEEEKRLVEHLEKRQQLLIRWRWVGLVGALVNISVGIYGLVCVAGLLHRPDSLATLLVAILTPTAYGLVGIGLGLLVYLALRWNGRPETRLLLKLAARACDQA